MKRIIIALIIALLSTASFAQDKLLITFTDFQAWAKQIKIAGYPLIESEHNVIDYTEKQAKQNFPNKAYEHQPL